MGGAYRWTVCMLLTLVTVGAAAGASHGFRRSQLQQAAVGAQEAAPGEFIPAIPEIPAIPAIPGTGQIPPIPDIPAIPGIPAATLGQPQQSAPQEQPASQQDNADAGKEQPQPQGAGPAQAPAQSATAAASVMGGNTGPDGWSWWGGGGGGRIWDRSPGWNRPGRRPGWGNDDWDTWGKK